MFLALLNRRSTILEVGGTQCSFIIVFKAGMGSGERSTDSANDLWPVSTSALE